MPQPICLSANTAADLQQVIPQNSPDVSLWAFDEGGNTDGMAIHRLHPEVTEIELLVYDEDDEEAFQTFSISDLEEAFYVSG